MESLKRRTGAQSGLTGSQTLVYAWPSPGIDIPDCAVEPTGSDEPVEAGREAVITSFTVYDSHGT